MSVSLSIKDNVSTEMEYSSIFDNLMQLATEASPALGRSMKDFGNYSIGKFLHQIPINASQAYQKHDDLLNYIDLYVSRLLGPHIASRAVSDLEKHPMILTANHHGVDYFAQSLQGSLLFSILKASSAVDCATVPIFSCGNIPLNNLTYPRGAMIYKVATSFIDKIPLNLPIYSDKRKRTIVSAAEPFNSNMVKRSLKRVNQLLQDGFIDPILSKVIESILNDVYCTPDVLSQSSYSDQAVIINNRIWKQLFTSDHTPPEMIYLELERIVAHLLTLDLCKPDSLITKLIMNDRYRKKIIQALDKIDGCWNQRLLVQRLEVKPTSKDLRVSTQGCGTHFFWGIDDYGRRFPLCLVDNNDSLSKFVGLDDRGKHWSFDLSVSAITKGLISGRLIPSLFTSYTTISFARGFTCIGGYYQSSYLPKMQIGVVDVMKLCGEDDIAHKIESIPAAGYLSGMQTVTDVIDGKYLIPAGPFEIIASGGISHKDCEAISRINIHDAHMASLSDTVADLIPHVGRKTEWKRPLFTEMYYNLYHRTLCKRYPIIN